MKSLRDILPFKYHPKLIEMLSALTLPGVLAANIIAPLIAAYILYTFVPPFQVYSWLFLHLVLFSGRVFTAKRLEQHLKIESSDVTTYLKISFVLTTLTALLYGALVWISILYGASDLHTIIITVVVLSLSAGAIATLVSIYHIYASYVLFSMVPLIAAVVYHGGELFNVYAFLLLIFTMTILRAGYRQYIILKDSIALKETFETIYEKSSDGIALIENNRFKDCNESIVRMFQYGSKEELLHAHLTNFMPKYQPDGTLSIKKMLQMAKIALKNGTNSFEWLYKKADGELFWAEVVLTKIYLDGEELIHGIWRDISQRKKLEHDNASLKERMALAFDGSRDGLWDWDLKNDTIYFSPRWKEMLGYRDDELENKFSTWQERVHPDDLEEVLNDIQLNLDGKSDTFEHKYRLKHKDGRWIWIYDRGKTQFDESGKAVRMIGTHTDLSTEINLTTRLAVLNDSLETKIEEAVSDLKKAQEQAKIGSWKLDLVNNSLAWSDETYKLFELPINADMATYENFLNAIHPDDRENVNAAYNNSLETQESYEIIHRLLMPDGRVKHVKEHCETSFDTEGKPLVSVGTIQDITAEHLAAQELRHKDEMLFEQSRLAQMGEMISMIAHQWRQPLNAISLTTAGLELKVMDDNYDKAFFQSRLQRIAEYVQHLSATIEDFRNFFKQDKVKQETTFSEIIESALSLIRIGLESKHITLQTEYNCKGSILSYPNELLQVVLNLIKNAEDALLENKIADPTIMIRCYSDADMAVLEIEDNAGGIDESIIEKIFEPYFTTKDEHNGTGLGLYMSKVIIEEHCNGVLSVGKIRDGAVFKIVLRQA